MIKMKTEGNREHHRLPYASEDTEVILLSWNDLFSIWHDKSSDLQWNCLFMLPPWIRTWWNSFGTSAEALLYAVRHRGKIIGIAPMQKNGNIISMMGSSDVTDYVDFTIAHDSGILFVNALISHMHKLGFNSLELGEVRYDSVAADCINECSRSMGWKIEKSESERIYELELPFSWEAYLNLLSLKERHEIRRKMRRLNGAGHVSYRVLGQKDDIDKAMDIFIMLFRSSLPEKDRFMTATREIFFRDLVGSMASYGMVKLAFLDIDNVPAAATLCFVHRSTVFLYNNGFDRKYSDLSAGILSRIMSIRQSISEGQRKYDFLKGDEAYKRKLGGSPVRLERYWVKLK